MKRREFIALIGAAAAAWPLGARAATARQVRRVGLLLALTETDKDAQRRILAFKEGMRKLGWIEGKNVRYEARWGAGNADRIKDNAKELVRLAPDVIFVNGTPSTVALHRETKSLPIVFAVVSDPVGDGVVASLARPGGNITGFITFYPEIVGKWLETLKEIAPQVSRVALLYNPRTAPFAGSNFLRPLFVGAAYQFSIEPIMAPVRDTNEIKTAIESMARAPSGGLLVMPDGSMVVHRATIIELAARHRLPAMYPFGYFVASGGLIAYGVDVVELNRRAASYVDRILNGAKPADLPVQAPTAFELAINLKTAKALGLTVPQTLLARADQLIE